MENSNWRLQNCWQNAHIVTWHSRQQIKVSERSWESRGRHLVDIWYANGQEIHFTCRKSTNIILVTRASTFEKIWGWRSPDNVITTIGLPHPVLPQVRHQCKGQVKAAPEYAAEECQGVAGEAKKIFIIIIVLKHNALPAELFGLRLRFFSLADLRCSKRARAADTAEAFLGFLTASDFLSRLPKERRTTKIFSKMNFLPFSVHFTRHCRKQFHAIVVVIFSFVHLKFRHQTSNQNIKGGDPYHKSYCTWSSRNPQTFHNENTFAGTTEKYTKFRMKLHRIQERRCLQPRKRCNPDNTNHR